MGKQSPSLPKILFKVLRFIFLFTIIMAVGFSPQTVRAGTETLVGEDGKSYHLAADSKADWELGKIEPILSLEAEFAEELNVIVHINSGNLGAVAREVKVGHSANIEALSEQIRAIYQKQHHQGSLTPAEEKKIAPQLNAMMSDGDRKILKIRQLDLDKALDAVRRDVGLALNKKTQPGINQISAFIISHGGKITSRIFSASAVGARIPVDLLKPLGEHELVLSILKDHPVEYELDVSVPSTDYNEWWSAGFDGGAYDFGIVDSGVQEDHPAFSGITFYSRAGSSVLNDHGTHVTGIVASGDSVYRGGAFGLDSIIWANSGSGADLAAMWSGTMDNMDWLAWGASQGPEVVNHSLGYGPANDTDYNDNDAFYDAFVEHFVIMVTKSAGNEYWNNTDPSMTHPAPAYNILVVANMDDQDTIDRVDDVRHTSSSVGPTLSGRKKPDITAPGTDILSTNNSWEGDSCENLDPNCWDSDDERRGCLWSRCSGTSMSAPHVAAAIILMEDAGNHNPMAQKAVLLNTADAWTSNDTATTADDGAVDGSYWDKSYGWGYLDMDEAYFNRSDYFVDSVVPKNNTATPDDYHLYKGRMYRGRSNLSYIEKATLVWHKRADYVAGDPPSTQFSLTDLNLRLYDEADNLLLDSELGGADNVHQVDISAGSVGWHDAVIKVYAWSSVFYGATSETYALATEEEFERADPPSFQHNYSRPNWVGPNQTFDVTVRIFNNGDVNAHGNTVTLNNITGVTVDDGNSHTLSTIVPGPYPDNPQETTYSLTTSGIGTAGTHWLPLDFESHSYGEIYAYSTTSGVSIVVELTPPTSACSSPAYANNSPISVSWTASDSQTGVKTSYLYVKQPGSTAFGWSGQSATGTSGTFNYQPSAGDGLYEFAIRSVDIGSNWEAIPTVAESFTFYDTVSPSSTCSTPTYETGASIPITFTSSDPAPASGIEWVDFWVKKGTSGSWTYTGLAATSTSGTVYYTPLAGDGTYYFYSRAKDKAQNPEPNASGDGKDSTVYDTVDPISSCSSAKYVKSSPIPVQWAASDATSGVNATLLYYKKESGGVWTYSGISQGGDFGTFNFIPGHGDGQYFFATRAVDKSGRFEAVPSGYGDTASIYDTQLPTGSILINGGAAQTDTLLVTLNLSAVDGLSGVENMRFSNNGSTWSPWYNYTNVYNNWNLSAYGGTTAPGIKIAYAQFSDYSQNVSVSYGDKITYQPLTCPQDYNGDLDVDGNDLTLFSDYFVTGDLRADLNRDGSVDSLDLAVFAEKFGISDCL